MQLKFTDTNTVYPYNVVKSVNKDHCIKVCEKSPKCFLKTQHLTSKRLSTGVYPC